MRKKKSGWGGWLVVGLVALIISPWLLLLCILIGTVKALHHTD